MAQQVAEQAISDAGPILTFLSGALFVKIVELGTQFVRDNLTKRQAEKTFIDEHLGPLLKEADDVCGKLRSEAERDFKGLKTQNVGGHPLSIEVMGFTYLIARFWGRVEIFRRGSLNTVIGKDQRGKKLQQLLSCMESQRVRIVPRLAQRAIGELMVSGEKEGDEIISFVAFVEKLRADASFGEWLRPLTDKVCDLGDKSVRQRILLYGLAVHVMIDVLDRNHDVTHDRPGYPNKLAMNTYRDANGIFDKYLPFVSSRTKYVGIRKKEDGPQVLGAQST